MRDFLLHIGLPKTATTFLQSSVFDNLRGWRHVYRSHGPGSKALCDAFRQIARAPSEGKVRAAQARLRGAAVDVLGTEPNDARVIVSHEPLSVGAIEMWNGKGVGIERLAIGIEDAIKELQIDRAAKILVGVRRQDQWLAARFAESCRGKYAHLNQGDFDDKVRLILTEIDSLQGSYDILNYDALADEFFRRFGRDNVAFIPVEALERNPRSVAGELSRFMKDRSVKSVLRDHAEAREHRNTLGSEPNVWQRRDGKGTITLSPDQSSDLVAAFRERNRTFGEMTGIDVADLGYLAGPR